MARVCILDPDRSSGMQVGETLPPQTRLVLDRLGLWDNFAGEGHEACPGSCSAWGSDTLGYNDFLLDPYGRGWHLDRPRFNGFMRHSASLCGVAIHSGARVDHYQFDRHMFQLHVPDQVGLASTLTARYVVDATGIRASFARRLGARRVVFDRLTFVCGFFDAYPGASASQLTMIEAVEDGWWYATSLPGRRVALSFATEPDTVREQRLSVEERWFARVLRTRYIAPRLNECRLVRGSLVIRAAPSFLLDRVAGERWLAVGDAAAAYDPLSSQGLYRALASGLEAAGVIAAAAASEAEIAASYASTIAKEFEEYQTDRSHLYGLERRWAASPFWMRRHASA